MKILSYVPILTTFFTLAGPCQAILIVPDPLSSEWNIYGTWVQRRLGSDSGTWFLPGGLIVEIGLRREGRFADPDPADIVTGRWAGVSGQLTRMSTSVGGRSDGLFFNDADNLGDDFQFLIKPGSDDMIHTFSFAGSYLPATDEWFGSYSSVVSPATSVPEGGGSLLLFCAALAGIHGLRLRFA